MAHGHDLPGLAVEFDADNTRKVLAKVVNRLAVGGGHHGHGLSHLVGLDRGTVVRRDGGGDFQRFGRGVVPIADFLRGIVGLAVIQICHPHGAALADLPCSVGADGLRRAVRVLDAQLGQQSLTVGSHAVFAGKHKAAHRPAACNREGQRVDACQKCRYIVGLILQIGLVAREAGGEVLLAQLLAVQLGLVDAHGCGVEPRAGNGFVRCDFLAENHRHGADLCLGEVVARVADPPALPGRLHAACLKGSGGGGGLACVVGGVQAHAVGGERQQRRADVGSALAAGHMGGPVADGQLGVGQLCALAVTAQGKPDAGCGAVGHAAGGQMLHRQACDFKHVFSSFVGRAARPEILLFSVSLPYHKNHAAAHNLHEMRSFLHKRFLVSSDFTRFCACILYTLPNTASKHSLFPHKQRPLHGVCRCRGRKTSFFILAAAAQAESARAAQTNPRGS